MRMLVAAVLVMISSGCVSNYHSAESDTKIFVFQSYFDQNCQQVEPFLEEVLVALHTSGVTVTFVDMSHTPQNMLFSQYFLYAANATSDFEKIMKVRKILFETAKWKYISELKLYDELKRHNVEMALSDIQPVYHHWSELIEKYGIESTPAVVRQKGREDYSVFTGKKEIEQCLKELKESLI